MPVMAPSNTSYPDDIVRGCVQYLLGLPSVTNLVGSDDDGAWIFEGVIGVRMTKVSTNTPGFPQLAMVVYNAGSWGSPNPGMTAKFPKIGIEIWADPPRDALGQVTNPQEARVAASYLYDTVDYYMNRTARGVVMFGDVLTWDSTRLGEIAFLPTVAADDHTIMGTVYYGLQTAAFFTPS
jgi:hypothetical protein